MRVAALDLGSNTFLMLVAEVNDQGRVTEVLFDECVVTRLSEGLEKSQHFSPSALERSEKCLKAFSEKIIEWKVEKVKAVATSAARDAKNSFELFHLVNKYQIPTEIISGQQEAELTFYGAFDGATDLSNVAVIDVGGGSTEVIGISEGQVKGSSLNIGGVRLTEKLITQHPIPEVELKELENYVRDQFESHRNLLPESVKQVFAVSGAPVTLSALENGVDFNNDSLHGSCLTVEQLCKWQLRLSRMSLEERLSLTGLQRGREDVVVAGATILLVALQVLGVSELTVSTRGVRYGLASTMVKF